MIVGRVQDGHCVGRRGWGHERSATELDNPGRVQGCDSIGVGRKYLHIRVSATSRTYLVFFF